MGFLEEADAQSSSLQEVGHRPWPVPDKPWLMGQTWRNLLFAHWRVPHDALRPHVPPLLELEQFDGSAWLGLTPFRLSGLRLRGLPPVPGLSACYELNCRTYVRAGDRPGIWFFSLDASSRVAVQSARAAYKLPYHYARVEANGDFRLERSGASDVRVRASYRGEGPAATAAPGSLEYFLTERYCLYADDGTARADIHHRPWRIRPAQAEVESTGLSPVELEGEPLFHLAERQDVVVWPLERLSGSG